MSTGYPICYSDCPSVIMSPRHVTRPSVFAFSYLPVGCDQFFKLGVAKRSNYCSCTFKNSLLHVLLQRYDNILQRKTDRSILQSKNISPETILCILRAYPCQFCCMGESPENFVPNWKNSLMIVETCIIHQMLNSDERAHLKREPRPTI